MLFSNILSNVYIFYIIKKWPLPDRLDWGLELDSRDSSLYQMLLKRRQVRQSGNTRVDVIMTLLRYFFACIEEIALVNPLLLVCQNEYERYERCQGEQKTILSVA